MIIIELVVIIISFLLGRLTASYQTEADIGFVRVASVPESENFSHLTVSDELARSLELERLTNQIGYLIYSSLDESKILKTAVEGISSVIEAIYCNSCSYNSETLVVRLEHQTGDFREHQLVLPRLEFPEIYSQIFDKRAITFCARVQHPFNDWVTILICPIQNREEVYGDLLLIKTKNQEFTSLEIQFTQHIADQCAIGIKQTRSFKEIQDQVRELQQAYPC
jgi:GAF domain-containing protein